MVPLFGFAQQGDIDEVTIIQGLFPETLDPHLTTVQATHNVSTQIYEPLVALDYDTMEHIPVLAESWTQVDPLTWEFKLREGVKFTNGEEFTAETVKYNFDRIARPGLPQSPKLPSKQNFCQRKHIMLTSTYRHF